jgi:hypothetical protein
MKPYQFILLQSKQIFNKENPSRYHPNCYYHVNDVTYTKWAPAGQQSPGAAESRIKSEKIKMMKRGKDTGTNLKKGNDNAYPKNV